MKASIARASGNQRLLRIPRPIYQRPCTEAQALLMLLGAVLRRPLQQQIETVVRPTASEFLQVWSHIELVRPDRLVLEVELPVLLG